MNKKTTTLLFTLALIITGCGDSKTQESTKVQEVKTADVKVQQTKIIKDVTTPKKVYSIDEIYNSMCVECHHTDGSGNKEKLTPSMVDLSQKEIQDTLLDIENDNGHVIMEHNRGKILEMGMEYKAEDMAKYMFEKFHKE